LKIPGKASNIEHFGSTFQGSHGTKGSPNATKSNFGDNKTVIIASNLYTTLLEANETTQTFSEIDNSRNTQMARAKTLTLPEYLN